MNACFPQELKVQLKYLKPWFFYWLKSVKLSVYLLKFLSSWIDYNTSSNEFNVIELIKNENWESLEQSFLYITPTHCCGTFDSYPVRNLISLDFCRMPSLFRYAAALIIWPEKSKTRNSQSQYHEMFLMHEFLLGSCFMICCFLWSQR